MDFLYKRIIKYSILCCVMVLTFASCDGTRGRFVNIDGYMLGTYLHISARTNSQSVDIYKRVMEVDREIKRSMSIFDENSLINRINRGETDSLDTHLIANIRLAREVYNLSDGAYDVTVKPLVDAYGFVGGFPQANVNVDSIMQFVGMDMIQIKGESIQKQDERVEIDLNSIAKGYTVDLVAHELELFGIKDYIVEVGGEIRCRGVNSKNGLWRVGIETPYEGNNSLGSSIQQTISLTNCAIATSGNYRRFHVDASGRKVTHIIDPNTGESALTDMLSATVITDRCAKADAYATMFVVLGAKRAIELAQQMEGVLVYFITSGENGEYKIYYSKELAPKMSHTEGYTAI